MKPITGTAKILCLFDYKSTTGFATVSTNIVKELRRRFGMHLELHIIPINYFGTESMLEDDHDIKTLIFPMTADQRQKDEFGRFAFLRRLNNEHYTGYFIIQDPGIGVGMVPLLEKEITPHYNERGWRKPRGLFYFPVDSTPLSTFFPTTGSGLRYFDQLVTYTEYGMIEIIKKDPELRWKVKVVPHGCNRQDFYPLSDNEKMAFRDTYFGVNSEKVIIINVNRNQFRKDIPTTMIGVHQFIQDKPHYAGKVFLYLHMHPLDPMGWDLRIIGAQLGWKEGVDYGFPPADQQNHGASMETLRGIYNAADMYLTTTSGEGWGLSITEAMMCECPVIAPVHTSLQEIGGYNRDRIWPLEIDAPYCALTDSVIRWQCSPWEVSERINDCLIRPTETAMKVVKARHYVMGLSWPRVCDEWEDIFRRLFFS